MFGCCCLTGCCREIAHQLLPARQRKSTLLVCNLFLFSGEFHLDFFWGYGDEAGRVAGRMKQTGYVWLLLPNGVLP